MHKFLPACVHSILPNPVNACIVQSKCIVRNTCVVHSRGHGEEHAYGAQHVFLSLPKGAQQYSRWGHVLASLFVLWWEGADIL